jgi:hypothetical protein
MRHVCFRCVPFLGSLPFIDHGGVPHHSAAKAICVQPNFGAPLLPSLWQKTKK